MVPFPAAKNVTWSIAPGLTVSLLLVFWTWPSVSSRSTLNNVVLLKQAMFIVPTEISHKARTLLTLGVNWLPTTLTVCGWRSITRVKKSVWRDWKTLLLTRSFGSLTDTPGAWTRDLRTLSTRCSPTRMPQANVVSTKSCKTSQPSLKTLVVNLGRSCSPFPRRDARSGREYKQGVKG